MAGAAVLLEEKANHGIKKKGEFLSKYDNLSRFLNGADPDVLRLGFDVVENILGFPLPASARRYPAWWANDASPKRHAQAWLSEGWMAQEVDLAKEMVTFRRRDVAATPRTASHRRDSGRGAVAIDLGGLPDAPGGEVTTAIKMRWKQLGALEMEAGALTFPAAPNVPALYRLRLLGTSGSRHYIGETENLRRRFRNYRNPGPSQQTSKRINAALREHLGAGGRVEIDIIVSGIELSVAGSPCGFDLSDKATRRLLEQAALVCNGALEVESLNR